MPNLRPTIPIPDTNPDRNASFETPFISDEVNLQPIPVDPLLGLDDYQRIFELHLGRLVLEFTYFPHIIVNPFLAG